MLCGDIGLCRRSFIGAAAAAGISFWASASRAAATASAGVNVRRFGVVGDGVRNDTVAFHAALRASPALFVPAGTYLLDRLILPAGSEVQTDGFGTVFRQRSGLPPGTRLLNVVGSGVRIGDCTVEGNIASDSGEQHHGIFVNATEATGDIRDVTIGNVRGANLRGDAVYLGVSKGRSLANVSIGDVHGSNVLRNLVSVVGGSQIRIGNISGDRVGYMHLDIEPDEGNEPVRGCDVASVRGAFVQVAGQNPESFVEGIRISDLQLTPPTARPIPEYPPGLKREHALEIRNLKSLEIGRFVVAGFPGAAIRQVWNPGALPDQYVHIHDARISDCARSASRGYVVGNRKVTHIEIDKLALDITRPGVHAILDCKSAHVGRATGKLAKDSRLIAQSPNYIEPLAYAALGATTAAAAFHFGRRLWR